MPLGQGWYGVNPNIGYQADLNLIGQLSGLGASTYATDRNAFSNDMDSLRRYLAAIYGYNTQGNIAGYQGQVDLEGRRIDNSGALDRANIGRDVARFQDQGQSYRTGLSENAATQRSIFDNQGADFRTLIGAQANTYAPMLSSDRFGQVWNGAAAPLLQTLFGITPGSPYQTRMPDFSGIQAPSYGQQAAPINVPPPVYSPAPAGGVQGGGYAPRTQTAPVTQQAQAAPQGGGVRNSYGPQPQPPSGIRTVPQGQSPIVTGGAVRPPSQAPAAAPITQSAPTQQRMPTPLPQTQPMGQPQYAQATQRMTPSVSQPLPTSFEGAPKITTGPVISEQGINDLVHRQQGFNAVKNAGSDRTAERATAAAGFSSNSPQLMAMKQQNSIARGFADQDAAVTIPAQYYQANANQRLASEQAAANVFAQRRQEELARRGQESGFQQNLLSLILGLAG